MSEIVVIKSSNQVGVIRREFTDNATGEQWVEVQPVGRAHGFNRFVRREDVETGGAQNVKDAIADIITNAVAEIGHSANDVINFDVAIALHAIKRRALELRDGDGNANPPVA